jgi:(p)ppGpp synthase/HD superfamily hydrolase
VAETVHDGQVRKDGSPMYGHVSRVASRVAHLGPHAEAVAFLHDVIEDTGLDYPAVYAMFGPEVAGDVATLSRSEGQTYGEFIEDTAAFGSYTALRVKLADLADNLMPADGAESLRDRYIRSDIMIRAALRDRFGE